MWNYMISHTHLCDVTYTVSHTPFLFNRPILRSYSMLGWSLKVNFCKLMYISYRPDAHSCRPTNSVKALKVHLCDIK